MGKSNRVLRVTGWQYTVNSEIFARILFSRIALKRHICDVNNSCLGQDLPISVNDRVISPFHEGLILTKINPRENFRIYSNCLFFAYWVAYVFVVCCCFSPSKSSFSRIPSVSNSLVPDQARHSVQKVCKSYQRTALVGGSRTKHPRTKHPMSYLTPRTCLLKLENNVK